MSSSDGPREPFSILLTLVKCQPMAAERARPERRASLRISRSRAPRASRACWTGVVNSGGVVLAVRNRDRPRGLEGGHAIIDQPGVLGQLVPLDLAVAGEAGEHD